MSEIRIRGCAVVRLELPRARLNRWPYYVTGLFIDEIGGAFQLECCPLPGISGIRPFCGFKKLLPPQPISGRWLFGQVQVWESDEGQLDLNQRMRRFRESSALRGLFVVAGRLSMGAMHTAISNGSSLIERALVAARDERLAAFDLYLDLDRERILNRYIFRHRSILLELQLTGREGDVSIGGTDYDSEAAP